VDNAKYMLATQSGQSRRLDDALPHRPSCGPMLFGDLGVHFGKKTGTDLREDAELLKEIPCTRQPFNILWWTRSRDIHPHICGIQSRYGGEGMCPILQHEKGRGRNIAAVLPTENHQTIRLGIRQWPKESGVDDAEYVGVPSDS